MDSICGMMNGKSGFKWRQRRALQGWQTPAIWPDFSEFDIDLDSARR
jgi:hypothetical protein